MKIFIIILVCTSLNAQVDCKCNIQNVLDVHNKLDSLTKPTLEKFLCSFDDLCKDNVEYSQFSNEVLFDVLNSNPNLLISVLDQQSNMIKSLVIKEISNPVNDKYEPKDLIVKIKYKSSTAIEIKKALEKAESKY